MVVDEGGLNGVFLVSIAGICRLCLCFFFTGGVGIATGYGGDGDGGVDVHGGGV